jgi:hypothetical protein
MAERGARLREVSRNRANTAGWLDMAQSDRPPRKATADPRRGRCRPRPIGDKEPNTPAALRDRGRGTANNHG